MFFKHPPTEARTLAKPHAASHSFDERQLKPGFRGWVDEKIKPARAADQHVSNECCSRDSLPEKPLKRRNSHPQHLTITRVSEVPSFKQELCARTCGNASTGASW
jgi:hypothetical protein